MQDMGEGRLPWFLGSRPGAKKESILSVCECVYVCV